MPLPCADANGPRSIFLPLYTRLTAQEVRTQLMVQKGYSDDDLPTTRTISTKLRDLGYYPSKVAKSQPQKRSPKPTPSSNKSPK